MPMHEHPEELDSFERIFRETGFPNPMIEGDAGASRWAYPNGLPRERLARWLKRAARRLRGKADAPVG